MHHCRRHEVQSDLLLFILQAWPFVTWLREGSSVNSDILAVQKQPFMLLDIANWYLLFIYYHIHKLSDL